MCKMAQHTVHWLISHKLYLRCSFLEFPTELNQLLTWRFTFILTCCQISCWEVERFLQTSHKQCYKSAKKLQQLCKYNSISRHFGHRTVQTQDIWHHRSFPKCPDSLAPVLQCSQDTSELVPNCIELSLFTATNIHKLLKKTCSSFNCC